MICEARWKQAMRRRLRNAEKRLIYKGDNGKGVADVALWLDILKLVYEHIYFDEDEHVDEFQLEIRGLGNGSSASF